MDKYKVKSPLKHDGVFHDVGSVVELPKKTGAYLLKSGSVMKVKSSQSQGNKTGKDSKGKKGKDKPAKSNE